MICKYCLTKIDDDSVFCESCGSRVQEIGNNDETQLIPRVEDLEKPAAHVVPSRAKASSGREKDIPVSDISKLLAEIYDDEDEEQKQKSEAEHSSVKTESVQTTVDSVQPELEHEPEPDSKDKPTEPENVEKRAGISDPIQKPDYDVDSSLIQPDETVQESGHSDTGEPVSLFCMACGRRLPDGAAFCDTCGTPTGAVSPVEIRRRKTKNSIVLPILKGYFAKPAEMIEKAVSEETAALGACILIIKDILAAVISALCMTQLTEGLTDSWILSGDAFGFAAKVFLMAVLADIILVALVFGIGILFKAAGTVKEVIGVCGVSCLLPSILWLLVLVLKGFVPAVSMCVSLVALVISVLFLGKAIDAAGRIKKNRSIYMTAVILVVYVVLIYGGLIWMIA